MLQNNLLGLEDGVRLLLLCQNAFAFERKCFTAVCSVGFECDAVEPCCSRSPNHKQHLLLIYLSRLFVILKMFSATISPLKKLVKKVFFCPRQAEAKTPGKLFCSEQETQTSREIPLFLIWAELIIVLLRLTFSGGARARQPSVCGTCETVFAWWRETGCFCAQKLCHS